VKGIQRDSASLRIALGEEADLLLDDAAFTREWDALYEDCPWATPFQSLAFVRAWYDSYRTRFDPVLLIESPSSGELVGIFPLALSVDSKQLVVAGARQAEYHAWIARAEHGESFIRSALPALRERFPGVGLVLRYLPPGAPAGWAGNAGLRGIPLLAEEYRSPMILVGDGSELAATLRKPNNRNQINRLKRIGEVHLDQVSDEAGLEAVFEDIIAYNDLRQGAMYGVLQFRDDPLKKAFHLALMRQPGLLDVTVLRAGDRILSGHLGMSGAGRVYLGIIAHNPFYSKCSPGKIHILLLGKNMAGRGMSELDLTPGAVSWKGRFANHDETVLKVTVFSGRGRLTRHLISRLMRDWAKLLLGTVRVDPAVLRRVLGRLRRVSLSGLRAKLLRRLWYDAEYRVYSMRRDGADRLSNRRQMTRDRISDLLCYIPPAGRGSLKDFLLQALGRLERENHVYTYVQDGDLLHCSWLIEGPKSFFFQEVNQEFVYPPGSAVIYDSYTDPKGRGKGLYQSCLSQILNEMLVQGSVERVYIEVLAEDKPSRHAIEKLGFVYECSMFEKARFGRSARWTSPS
jgi:CelD/BcsL family acetyltransferase involved in cellulose biosynthesis/GNAT superfamily N-acetyltransferase